MEEFRQKTRTDRSVNLKRNTESCCGEYEHKPEIPVPVRPAEYSPLTELERTHCALLVHEQITQSLEEGREPPFTMSYRFFPL